jgi:hypothetical protein
MYRLIPRARWNTTESLQKALVYSRTIILNSWKHSCNTGVLPASHGESVIALLPKEGKDIKDIKN